MNVLLIQRAKDTKVDIIIISTNMIEEIIVLGYSEDLAL